MEVKKNGSKNEIKKNGTEESSFLLLIFVKCLLKLIQVM